MAQASALQAPMRRLSLLVLLLALLLSPLPLPADGQAGKKRVARKVPRKRNQQAPRQAVDLAPCTALDAKLRTAPVPRNSGGGLALVRPSDVFECARTRTTFTNATLRLALQDLNSTILYFQNFYSLLPLARKSPDPDLPSEYDIVAALRQLATRPWVYREELYGNISLAVDRLEDAHTAFIFASNVPTYYRLVLPLVGVVENGEPTVRIAPLSLNGPVYPGAAEGPPFRFNASLYYGARVVSIQGTPAWSYMMTWVRDNAGGYHNLGQKVNEAFARLTFGSNRRTYSVGNFAGRLVNPRSDFLDMVVQRNGSATNESISVPWLAAVDMSYFPYATSGTASASRQLREYSGISPDRAPPHLENSPMEETPGGFGAPGKGTVHRRLTGAQAGGRRRLIRRGLAEVEDGEHPILMRRRERVPEKFKLDPPSRFQTPRKSQLAMERISTTADLWEVYKLADNRTGVVAIGTFSLADGSGNPLDRTFVNETLKAFATLNRFNCTQIIIDLTGNPGGFVQFGTWFIQMLMGSAATSSLSSVAAFDTWRFLAGSTFAEDVARQRSGLWSPYNWADTSGNRYTFFTRGRFFFPTESITFSGSRTPAVYSRAFLYPQTTVQSFRGVSSQPPAFANKRVVLFSDGLCFSTCNTVASTLKRSFGIPLVTAGGLYNGGAGGPAKMVFAGGGGGFVSGDVQGDLLADFGSIGARDSAPKRFNGPVLMAMRLAAGFYSSARTPVEFSALRSDFQVNYTLANVADASRLYADVARYFSR